MVLQGFLELQELQVHQELKVLLVFLAHQELQVQMVHQVKMVHLVLQVRLVQLVHQVLQGVQQVLQVLLALQVFLH